MTPLGNNSTFLIAGITNHITILASVWLCIIKSFFMFWWNNFLDSDRNGEEHFSLSLQECHSFSQSIQHLRPATQILDRLLFSNVVCICFTNNTCSFSYNQEMPASYSLHSYYMLVWLYEEKLSFLCTIIFYWFYLPFQSPHFFIPYGMQWSKEETL